MKGNPITDRFNLMNPVMWPDQIEGFPSKPIRLIRINLAAFKAFITGPAAGGAERKIKQPDS